MNSWTQNIRPALVATAIATFATGFAYPALVWIPSRLLLREQATGSIVRRDGRPVGSHRIAQASPGPGFFHPRPSAAGSGWAADSSGGSNAGPLNRSYVDTVVPGRTAAYRSENGLPPGEPVPASAVAASGSGLDPDITLEDALLQAPRVARERGIDPGRLAAFVRSQARDGFWHESGDRPVEVLALNLALERGSVR